jgi:pyruvate/2-oxoglutarate dehydrogenase complex dihydrolipoamide dehydrogenase (E3) component
MSDSFDAIVIGTGQAGPPLAARLSQAGMRVAVIERDQFGGTCVNNGCTPTKAMVASAYAARMAQRAAEYGVRLTDGASVDMKRVKARKDEITARSSRGVERWMRELPNGRVFAGHARFLDRRTVAVADDRLTAPRIFVDVGGRPRIPDMPGIETVPYLTNVSLMDVDFVPEHLIIVGGSYIGLEFGQMFRRFGSRVTVVEMSPRLISREDPDVSDAIADIFRAEHIDLRLSATCLALQKGDRGVRINVKCEEGEPSVEGSHLLLAIGRAPNTEALGLDAAGIECDEKGYIKVDEELRTSNPNVWALGDCNGRGAFTHTSYNDFEIVAANLLNGGTRKVSERIPVYALFTDPPLGRVGMSEADVKRAGIDALIGKRPMTRVSRAVEKGETQGFMKVLVDAKSRHIVGAAVLGTGGDEVVHSVLDAMYAKLPYTDVARGMRIHPTVSELIPTVLGDLKPLA